MMIGSVFVPYSLLLAVSVKVRTCVRNPLFQGLRLAKCPGENRDRGSWNHNIYERSEWKCHMLEKKHYC